jgi:hypothetical protein
MKKFLIISSSAMDTRLPNSDYQEAEEKGELDQYYMSDITNEYDTPCFIGTYEAMTPAEAIEQARAELIDNGYSKNLSFEAYELAQ